MSHSHNELTVIDLFSGAGGASLGFKRAGFRLVAAADIDPEANETYAKNLKAQPIQADLNTMNGGTILKETGMSVGELTALVGCPPCQGFAPMRGKPDPNDERNELVAVYARMVKEIRPTFVVFENVHRILKLRFYLDLLLEHLIRLGYKYVYDVLDAADFGVPQRRKRLVVVATRDKHLWQKLRLPSPTHVRPNLATKSGLHPWETVREAIADLPPLEHGQTHPYIPNHTAMKHSQKVLEIIRHIPKNGGSRADLPKELWLPCHRNHKGHCDVYGRMRWDNPAPTITSGCTNPSKGRFIHPEQHRAITPREAARLQTFPDGFVFFGSMTSVARQVGNSWPPLFAKHIAEAVRGVTLEGEC